MISHTHRCIFVHIPKCGGSSVENLIWPPPRKESDLWMGFVDPYHNKYQTGGLQHLYAAHIEQEVGTDVFRDYYKFAFVRNPWDRVVSQFVTMQRRPDLRAFVGMREEDGLARYLDLIQARTHVQWDLQYNFVHDQTGNVQVDDIGRLENYAHDLRRILANIGITVDSIPHANRSAREHYRQYYSAETRDKVREMYRLDIEWLDYRFED